ncbi:MAG TPA: hypothetical protein VNZ03_08875 [Terriglobales bacterium]|jgi:hypothetical protein|nr:hypothetical protein [Terriglobales bacterium]
MQAGGTRRIVEYFTAHKGVAFLLIFLLAFSIRFVLLVQHREDIDTVGEEPKIAYALISKGEFADPYVIPTGPTAHSTPFFPVLLVAIYKTFGTGFAGQFARGLLIISGYSLLFALYPTFASAFGFPYQAGLLAGFVSALVPVRRSAEVFRGWEETWSAMALAFLLFLMLKREESRRREPMTAVWIGLCWGAALYINFSIAAVLVALLFVDWWTHRTVPVLRDAVITMIVVFAVISPWIIRNQRQLHGWTMMRDNLGLELRFGNHDGARPSAEGMVMSLQGSTALSTDPGKSIQEAMLVREMGEIAYNRRELHLAVDWISHHPGEFVWLSVQRFFYFWLGPLNHAYETIVISSYTILGFLGLGLMRKRVGEIQFRMWCTVFAVYPLICYLVPFAHRYRVPIDWMIWLSAGLFVCVMLEKKSALADDRGRDSKFREMETLAPPRTV